MKNPYKRNIALLTIIIILSSIVLSIVCPCNESCCSNIHLSETILNIIIGLISSSILLLIVEYFQFLQDRKLGYLQGIYSRTIIANLIENTPFIDNEKREEELTDVQRSKFKEKNLSPLPGSRYVEIDDYKSLGKDLIIKIKYLHHGIYEGTAEYFKYWEPTQPFGQKTIVKFTLTLNISNLSTGEGSYKYVEYDDYGIYSIQINDEDKSEILVIFKNTIPNGLSAGFEKWKRIK
jgi:hypothetical protein